MKNGTGACPDFDQVRRFIERDQSPEGIAAATHVSGCHPCFQYAFSGQAQIDLFERVFQRQR